MSDQYSMLMGLDLSDEEKMRMVADGLRGKQQAADFFSMSTVPTISGAAQSRVGQLQDTGERVGVLKNALADRQSREEQQQMNRDSREREGAANRQNRLLTAAMGNQYGMDPSQGNRAGYNPRKPYGSLKTSSERKRFEEIGGELAVAGAMKDTYKDEYGPTVPGSGNIENFIGNYLPDEWDLAERADWFADFEKFYSMPKRHNIFGSAFTKVEQEAWNRANFSPNTQPEVVHNRLRTIEAMAKRLAEKQVITAFEKNVSLDLIEANYGDVVDVRGLINTWENDREQYYQKRAQDLANAAQFLKSEGVEEETVAGMYQDAMNKLQNGDNAEPVKDDEHAALRRRYGLDQ